MSNQIKITQSPLMINGTDSKTVRCAYSAKERSVIDLVRSDGSLVYTRGQSIEDLRAKYPDIEVISENEAMERREATYIKPPKLTTRARFYEMFGAVPPMHLYGNRNSAEESFKVSELICGQITSIFYRRHGAYWELQNSIALKHADIAALVAAAPEAQTLRFKHRLYFPVTYEIVTPKSAETGDYEEQGAIDEGASLRDALKAVTQTRTNEVDGVESIEADDSFATIRIVNGQEFKTGANESRTLHIPPHIKRTSARRIARILGVKV